MRRFRQEKRLTSARPKYKHLTGAASKDACDAIRRACAVLAASDDA